MRRRDGDVTRGDLGRGGLGGAQARWGYGFWGCGASVAGAGRYRFDVRGLCCGQRRASALSNPIKTSTKIAATAGSTSARTRKQKNPRSEHIGTRVFTACAAAPLSAPHHAPLKAKCSRQPHGKGRDTVRAQPASTPLGRVRLGRTRRGCAVARCRAGTVLGVRGSRLSASKMRAAGARAAGAIA